MLRDRQILAEFGYHWVYTKYLSGNQDHPHPNVFWDPSPTLTVQVLFNKNLKMPKDSLTEITPEEYRVRRVLGLAIRIHHSHLLRESVTTAKSQ